MGGRPSGPCSRSPCRRRSSVRSPRIWGAACGGGAAFRLHAGRRDTCASAAGVFLSLTLVGEAGRALLTRDGARPGDLLFVTGTSARRRSGCGARAVRRRPAPARCGGAPAGTCTLSRAWRSCRARRDAKRARGAGRQRRGFTRLGRLCEASRVGAEVHRRPAAGARVDGGARRCCSIATRSPRASRRGGVRTAFRGCAARREAPSRARGAPRAAGDADRHDPPPPQGRHGHRRPMAGVGPDAPVVGALLPDGPFTVAGPSPGGAAISARTSRSAACGPRPSRRRACRS